MVYMTPPTTQIYTFTILFPVNLTSVVGISTQPIQYLEPHCQDYLSIIITRFRKFYFSEGASKDQLILASIWQNTCIFNTLQKDWLITPFFGSDHVFLSGPAQPIAPLLFP